MRWAGMKLQLQQLCTCTKISLCPEATDIREDLQILKMFKRPAEEREKKLPGLSADYTKQTIYLTPVRSTLSLNLTDLQLSTPVYLHVIKRSLLHSRGTNEQTLSSCEYKASDMQYFYFQPQNMHFI